jgi:hypothetical protein
MIGASTKPGNDLRSPVSGKHPHNLRMAANFPVANLRDQR